MTEVKSTLEIALEKAKTMEISPEDRRRFKQEEMLSRAKAIFQDYVDHRYRSETIPQALKENPEDASFLRASLIKVFVGALEPGQPADRIWEGLGELGLSHTAPFEEALTRITENHVKNRQEAADRVKHRMANALNEIGISGTAVDLNIEASDLWRDSVRELNRRKCVELDKLRQDMIRTIERRSNFPR
jgi:hypothetical protein